ncbi:MAG: proprotein convertase P-domain-containing protein, partial [Planctomycetota bacterium]
MIAVDGGVSFPQWENLGLRTAQHYGSSIAVYQLPVDPLIGPSLTPMVRELLQSTELSIYPVFAHIDSSESVKPGSKDKIDPTTGVSVATKDLHVRWANSDDPALFNGEAQQYLSDLVGVESVRRLSGTPDQFVVTLNDDDAFQTLSAANAFDADPNLQWAIPDWYHQIEKFAVPNDPLFGNQWHADNTGQFGSLVDHDVNLPEAWDINAGGSADIVVGVIDDGVANDHEDLTVWVNPGENGADEDNNGWTNDVNGWNFVNNNNNSSYTADGDNHGTSVAGLAAADGDNGIGVVGGAYNSPVISARIFDGSSVASTANIAASIYYMAGRTEDGTGTWASADVVNNSWGGGPDSVAISDALVYGTTLGGDGSGIPFLFATGNSGRGFLASFPARYSTTIEGVIAVGATGNTGDISTFSQGGAPVDIVAPSNANFAAGTVTIETTDLMGTIGYADGNYTGAGATGFGGTSAATPISTGIAALALAELEAQAIDLTPGQFRDLMRANTRLIADLEHDAEGHNLDAGYGMIDAHSLLRNIGSAEISVLSSTEELLDGAGQVDFGSTDVGVPVESHILIRNQGTSDLDITSLTLPGGDFSVQTDGTPATLGPGQRLSVPLVFNPSSAGESVETLTIASADPDEPDFEVELRGLGTVIIVQGTVFEDREGDGIQDPVNEVVPGTRVFLDLNQNGVLDLGTTFEATTPVNIVDLSTVLSPIDVAGITAYDRIEVNLDITHTFVSDLTIELVAPDGTAVTLADGVGGFGDNFVDTTFDDSATTSINEGSAPFTGVFRPEEPLSNLLDLDANGTWNLRVFDAFNGDEGAIERWSLIIGAAEPSASTDDTGLYEFRNIPDGTYDFGFADDAVWSAVSPSGPISIDIVDGAPLQVIDFGIAKNDVAYIQTFRDNDGDGALSEGDGFLDDPFLFIDSNSNGVFDPGAVLSIDPNLAITDNNTITSVQSVSGFVGTPADIDVVVNASHTFTGDVTITLTGPGGETATLVERRGGGGNDFIQTVFDDEAPTAIASAGAPFTGRFMPETPLSVFAGVNPNGDWTLSVQDSAGGDTGVLENWELRLLNDGQIEIGADGWTEWPISDGGAAVGLAIEEAFEYTVPVSGIRELTPDGTPQLGLLYGARRKPPALGGKVFVDRDGDNAVHPTEPGVDNAIVFLDGNGNGVQDFASEFIQDADVLIDTFFPTTSMLGVSGRPVIDGDLRVSLDIDYSAAGSLQVDLIAPGGTRITLVNDVGGTDDDFTGTFFDDNAETSIIDGTAPFNGTFRPIEPLSTFDGLDPNGTWTLEVTTDSARDSGTLLGWSLVMGSDEPSITTDSQGDFGFFNLDDGEYNVAMLMPADWSGTGATSYTRTVNGTNPSFSDLHFGIAQNDHAYVVTFMDENADGIIDPGETVMPATGLFVDSNENGLFDPIASETYENTDDLAIGDNATFSSEINVPDTGETVADLQVELNLTHTFTADLGIDLVAPDGSTRVNLFNRRGGSGNDLLGTRFDDAADTDISSGVAPFTGTFRPEELLSTFDGLATDGTWTLEVTDNAGGDQGTLLDWSLTVVTQISEPTMSTDEHGWHAAPLENGASATIGVIPIDGLEFTVPPTGLMTMTGDGTPQTNMRFGLRPEPANALIARRAIFYAGSTGADISDAGDAEAAIDTSKSVLLPGESSTFANYSSYFRGLNGMIVD